MAREYGFKFAPRRGCAAAITLTLPYAGVSRIRFEGLPDEGSGSQSAKTDTPSMGKPLTKGINQVKLPAPPGGNEFKTFKLFKPFKTFGCLLTSLFNPASHPMRRARVNYSSTATLA